MALAISGASGQLGRLTAEALLGRVAPEEVVLLTRTPDSLADFAARGAQIRVADFNDPQTLPAAFAGVDRLLLISTDDVFGRTAAQVAAVEAAASAGVAHIYYTSIPSPDETPALVGESHAATERAMRESGADWTALRNNLYTEMQLPTVTGAIESGQVVANSGDGSAAYVTREDCAAVAAAALAGGLFANEAVDVTGPTAVSAADFAAIASEISGKEIETVLVDDETATAGIIASGVPEAFAPLMASFGRAIREGCLSNVTDVVERATGKAPTSLAELAKESLRQ